MSKVPCGGFELDDNFLGMNKNGELSLTSGSEGTPYQQLVTDGDGNAKWEDKPYFNVNVVDSYIDSLTGLDILTLDATKEQIYAAYESGKQVFINMMGLLNVNVQKDPGDGSLYAFGLMPKTTSAVVTKLALMWMHTRPDSDKWIMATTYISATTEP